MKKPLPFGKYYLLERINVGGMAEVFRAKAYGVEGFERLVAVKRILPNIAEDKEFIKMFIDEAKIAVQLNHANIAQIFDLGVVDSSYYIALEHVHGRDLRAIFDRCRSLGEPMPVAQACFVVMKVCEGLDYAHNKRDQLGKELNLVHRDVSPQNVLVSFEGEVKLIDFGIAKAAGKGAKTQAGILKGKFGYMSPEQVRGLPIDRRSDIFSCGIVLYELLTGERLFVGESDFSTLEKVRNVEILPPSTYNRKIPDELERIVLKALAKDTEDRYQNSIDLHDELQAFVYTAGEFYSRKDLAGWMKRTFAKEIDEETAKLESYRQLKPPTDPPVSKPVGTQPPPNKPVSQPPPVRRQTAAMGAVGASGTRPPPPPSVRTSQQVPIVAAPPPSASSSGAPLKIQTRRDGDDDLAWDDDELETQIYDNPEEDVKKRPTKTGVNIPSPGATLDGPMPDLSSLVSTAKGWDPPGLAPPPKPGMPATTLTGVTPPPHNKPSNGAHARPTVTAPSVLPGMDPLPPSNLATGSNRAPSPYVGSESAAVASLVGPSEPVFDYAGNMSTFGSSMLGARKKQTPIAVIVGAAVLVVAGGIGLAIALRSDDDPAKSAGSTAGGVAAGTGSAGSAAQPATPQVAGAQDTGFDLYVMPAQGIQRWRLDGDVRTDKLPSRIRGITPGVHTVQIDAPPGFLNTSQQITVEAGKAPKVEIVLDPMEIVGKFDSTPPGAKVTLLVGAERIVLGPAPQQSKLDPRKTYQVLFEKDGFVSRNMPVNFTGGPQESIAAVLDKAEVAVRPDTRVVKVKNPVIKPPDDGKGPGVKPPDDGKGPGVKPPDDTTPKPAAGEGTLLISSKPPCEIYVDGKNSGLKTPQREMKLGSGKHKITLINNEFGIKESFWVDIKANDTTKAVKDFMDKVTPQ